MKRSAPMKRSGFQPKAKPLPGILRTAQLPKTYKPMKSRRKAVPAHELTHYRAVAALPCARCGIEGYSQCAHSNRAEDGKGAGKKAHYLATFPLCCTRPGEIGCHAMHDQCIGGDRAEMDRRTVGYIADTKKKLGVD